jgi:hypothetical protein
MSERICSKKTGIEKEKGKAKLNQINTEKIHNEYGSTGSI